MTRGPSPPGGSIKSLSFTFRNLQGTLYIGKAELGEGKMDFELWGIESLLGRHTLQKQ